MRPLLALLVFATATFAQDWLLTRVAPSGPAPSPRIDGTITYDAERFSLFLFGGSGSGALNDLWRFSLATERWEQLSPTGPLPPARFGHTLVTDTRRNRIILFGGQARGFFSDVWAFDPATNAWRQLAFDAAGPSNRYGHSAVYDDRGDRLIISHGFTNSGRFDDTWAFEFATNTWRNLTPSGTRPLRRCLHHSVLDSTRQRMYLFGGCASGFGPCPLGDLWYFDLTRNQWTQVSNGPNPPAREHYGFAFDSRTDRVLVYGGTGAGNLRDIWSFDAATNAWRAVSPAGAPAPALYRHQAAYVPERGATFFFGGSGAGGDSNELLRLDNGLPALPWFSRSSVTNAFSNAAGEIAPGEYVALYGDSFPAGATLRWGSTNIDTIFTSASQINFRVPPDTTPGESAVLQVAASGKESRAVTVPIVALHPGLFPTPVNADGSLNAASRPAPAGLPVVLYATGHGRFAGTPVVELDGAPIAVAFAGPSPGVPTLFQINAIVPASTTAGPHQIKIRLDGVASQADVIVYVR